jgi:hypothetical protein
MPLTVYSIVLSDRYGYFSMLDLDALIQDSQAGVVEEVQRLVEENGIKEQVLREAQTLAQQHAMYLMNPQQFQEPPAFPGIPLDNESRDEFLLVLDYLESIGLKFTPNVLRYESQHPDIATERDGLCRRLNLRSYDRTPLLVQLIEERYNSLHPEE